MKTVIKKIAAVTILLCTAGSAFAQDYNNWGVIDPYGLQMQDQWGDIHYTNPYAYDSQVDAYGNVIYSENGYLEPSLDYYELTPVQPSWNSGSTGYDSGSSSTYVPYANPTDSHQSFINSIWE